MGVILKNMYHIKNGTYLWQGSQKSISGEVLIRHEDLKKFSKRVRFAARLLRT